MTSNAPHDDTRRHAEAEPASGTGTPAAGPSGQRYVLTGIGDDRPGVLAAMTRAIIGAGCVIERATVIAMDTAFSATLLVTVPAGGEGALRSALIGISVVHDVKLHVDPLPDGVLHRPVVGNAVTVTARGADESDVRRESGAQSGDLRDPGAVLAAISDEVAGFDVNIVDVRMSAGGALSMDVVIPPGVDMASLASALDRAGGEVSDTA